jgi:hypothetical protein
MSSSYTQHAYGGDIAEVFYKYYVDGVSYADVHNKAFWGGAGRQVLTSQTTGQVQLLKPSGDEPVAFTEACLMRNAGP